MQRSPNAPLIELIQTSYSVAEAERHTDFKLDDAQRKQVADIAIEMLKVIPPRAAACALMSAMWAAAVRDKLSFPAYCVAGELLVNGKVVFGNETIGAAEFNGVNLDWDGHCWICVEDYVGDASLFRTAYSSNAPSILREFVLQEFGAGKGVLLTTSSNLHNSGLTYVPRYVVNETQLTGLVLGARETFTGK